MLKIKNILIAILAFIIISLPTFVFATPTTEHIRLDFSDEVYNVLKTLPEYSQQNKYWIIVTGYEYGNKVSIRFIEIQENLKFYLYCREWSGNCKLYGNKNISFIEYTIDSNGKNLSNRNVVNNVQINIYCDGKQINGQHATWLYSTTDIYSDNTYTDFFFQTEKYKIPILKQVEELPKAVIVVMKLIIPVGLGILSMLLLIFLIKYVISRLK